MGIFALRRAANTPQNDTGSVGGAVVTLDQVLGDILDANEKIKFVSDSASDVQDITIFGRYHNGEKAISRDTMTGTTAVTTTEYFRQILEIELSSVAIGSISIMTASDDEVIATLVPGELKASAVFKYAVPKQAASVVRYEKIFVKLTSAASETGITAVLTDPSSNIEIGAEAAKNDSNSIANRLAAPAGITFSAAGESVSLPDLDQNDAAGVWLKQTLTLKEFVVDANALLTVAVS